MVKHHSSGHSMHLLCGLLLVTSNGLAQDPVAGDLNELRRSAFAAELQGNYSVAADAFLKLCDKDQGDSRWYLRAGDNLGKSGRFNDAMDLLEQARRRFRDVPELGVMLCRTFHLKAEDMRRDGIWDDNVAFYYRQAAGVAKELLSLNPRHLEALLGLAQAEFALGDSTNAELHAGLAIEAHPNSAGGHLILGKIHYDQFIGAKTRFSEDQPEAVAKAEAIAEISRLRDLAVASFLSAKKADPTRAYPMVALGDIDAWMGDLDAAFNNYRDAMLIDPSAAIKHDWLRQNASIDQRLALYDGVAESYADKGAKARAIIDWYRALVRFDQGSWKESTQLFAGTLAQLPDITDTYYYLMQSAYWSSDEGLAVSYAIEFAAKPTRARFADLIRDDRRSLAILRVLARNQIEAEALATARDLNHVLAYATHSASDWNNYAYLCRQTQQFEQGLVGYQMALAIEPESPQLLNDTAVILQHDLKGEQNLTRARELYHQAIELAEAQLAAGGLSAEERTRTQKALADAKLNLAEMK